MFHVKHHILPIRANKGLIAVADQLKTYYNDYSVKSRTSLKLACDCWLYL